MPVHSIMLSIVGSMFALGATSTAVSAAEPFEGKYFSGSGDVEYLQLLDISRRMFAPDPEFQNMSMLYMPEWNGLVEGPTWGAWWVQNSYGATYCALPFYEEPFTTFLQNAQDLWFSQMGDGKREGANKWVAPDGCLCDCASPGWVMYKQGDGRIDIHDWGVEFSAAGLLMQCELLLISRDEKAIAHYLPMLGRVAAFVESRRDPKTNLFLAGPAGNLLAPSYAGYKKPDGTYGKAYLAGLSITYIAALDRLIEVEKLAGSEARAAEYMEHRALARKGLPELAGPDGCFIKSLDPDGTRHGVYGAAQYGYFEASPNHDAVCFRVADDAQSKRILDKMLDIRELRPHDLILANAPGLDDMYEKPEGLWANGTWVNGGHWSTCEGRMMMAYARFGKYDEMRRTMQAILKFARQFRMDNPLVDFGAAVYQPKEPINLCYDTFAPPAAMVRGLFEYLYRADALDLVPHVPSTITRLDQRFPIRFGTKRLYLSTIGAGPVTAVTINGRTWKQFDAMSIHLSYADLPETARICVAMGGTKPVRVPRVKVEKLPKVVVPADASYEIKALCARGKKLAQVHAALLKQGKAGSYEAAHARLAVEAVATVLERRALESEGKLAPLASPESQAAADASYVVTANKLCDGIEEKRKRAGPWTDNVHFLSKACRSRASGRGVVFHSIKTMALRQIGLAGLRAVGIVFALGSFEEVGQFGEADGNEFVADEHAAGDG
ncbi:MAG TPA: hypothetical protein PLO62_11040 [Candidatus Hydrogenedentes bacterium]|nr:hypothetical protein [Candidatus Hydrogenedentota bacterium]HOS01437.1 hypothetical protein [Candidatus Hydrogenedentota bacterium]